MPVDSWSSFRRLSQVCGWATSFVGFVIFFFLSFSFYHRVDMFLDLLIGRKGNYIRAESLRSHRSRKLYAGYHCIRLINMKWLLYRNLPAEKLTFKPLHCHEKNTTQLQTSTLRFNSDVFYLIYHIFYIYYSA